MTDTQMTYEDLERYVSTYGVDITLWPETVRLDAVKLMDTKKGKAIFEAEQALDDMLMSLKNESKTVEPSDGFIDQLKVISALPQQVKTSKAVKATNDGFLRQIKSLLDDLAESLSPKVLIAQGSAMACALVLGIYSSGTTLTVPDSTMDQIDMAGLEGTDFYAESYAGTEQAEEVDISESLFTVIDYDSYDIDTAEEM